MAVEQLSAKLKTFKDNVNTSTIASMKNAASEIANSVNSAMNAYDSALSGIQSGIKEDMGDTLSYCMSLVLEASKRLKASMDTDDMASILAQCESLYKYIVEEIEEKIKYANTLEPGGFREEWVILDGLRQLLNKWFANDQYKLDRVNAEIENMNKNGEAQLTAIAEVANAVDLGIIGKMSATNSEGLGGWVTFSGNYHFNRQEWAAANPVEYPLTIVDTVGSFVVGQVEGVVNIAEGLVDAVLTPVACVTSALGLDVVRDIIEFDASKWVGDRGIDLLEAVGGQEDAGARSAGKVVGEVAGVIALTAVTAGAGTGALGLTAAGAKTLALGMTAVSVGGSSVESTLQSGGTMGQAAFAGVRDAGITFVSGKLIPAGVQRLAGTRVGTMVTGVVNSAKNSAVGRVITNVGGRVVKIISTPARITANAIFKNPVSVRGVTVLSRGLATAGNVTNSSKIGQRLAGTNIGRTLGFQDTVGTNVATTRSASFSARSQNILQNKLGLTEAQYSNMSRDQFLSTLDKGVKNGQITVFERNGLITDSGLALGILPGKAYDAVGTGKYGGISFADWQTTLTNHGNTAATATRYGNTVGVVIDELNNGN